MSPTNLSAFERLPAEVHGEILRQMASPEDVYSTIRASPKALGSFLCFREDILIRVIQAHLPPEIFAEYLGLLQFPKYEDFNHVPNRGELPAVLQDRLPVGSHWEWEACKFKAWSDVVHRFFKSHFKNVDAARSTGLQIYSKPKASEKAEVDHIVSIYGMLKRFIRDYQLFARKNMTNFCPNFDFDPPIREAQLLQIWPPLSQSETSRLHRGFLRYELCCRLNTIPDRNGAMVQSKSVSGDFFRHISEYIDDWEEEEIRCIWVYVAKQYEGVARDVVEDFCCDVWRLSRKARHAPESETTLAPSITSQGSAAEYYGFEDWEDSMSCLGLPLLQQVLQSGVDDQRRFLKNINLRRVPPYFRFPFLWLGSGVDCERHHMANHVYKSITLAWPMPEDSDEDRPHAGWLHEQEVDDILDGLRDTGWVFWEDRSRLEYFTFPGHRVDGHHISHYISNLYDQANLAGAGFGGLGMSARYPEQTMFVTKEDHRELLEKYAAKPVEPDGEYFFLDRLRAISEWSSKEVSPAFQEVCSGTATMDP